MYHQRSLVRPYPHVVIGCIFAVKGGEHKSKPLQKMPEKPLSAKAHLKLSQVCFLRMSGFACLQLLLLVQAIQCMAVASM
jgi:hypothetical protein